MEIVSRTRFAGLAAAAALAGCATKDASLKRTVADVPSVAGRIRTVGVMPIDVRIYELPAVGADELRADWSQEASVFLAEAGAAELRRRGFESRILAPVEETAAELDEVRRLLRAIAASLVPSYPYVASAARTPGPLAVRNPSSLPSGPLHSVGDVSRLAEFYGVDAFAMIAARGEVSSGLRTAGQAVLIPLVAILTAAGGPGVFTGTWGTDQVDVTIVDRRGDLLWFARYESQSTNLRDAASAARSAAATLDVHGATPADPAVDPGKAPGP